MASISEIFGRRKKLLIFLAAGIAVAVAIYFLVGGETELRTGEGEILSRGPVAQDEAQTSEAENLTRNMRGRLGFFGQAAFADYFEKHDLIIPVTVELNELAVDSPFTFVEQRIVLEETALFTEEIIEEIEFEEESQ